MFWIWTERKRSTKNIFNASFFEMKDYPYDARGITLNETPESLEGALVKHPSRRPSHEHGTILFFEVDDVDETVEHVKKENIPVWREPFSIGHSPERMAIVGDSEGNAIGIMSF